MFKRITSRLIGLVIVVGSTVVPQPLPGQVAPPKITGSRITAEDALQKSDVIFIGQITSLGVEEYHETAEPYPGPNYQGAKVKVVQTLRGSLKSPAVMTIFVGSVVYQETIPTVGYLYIVFAIRTIKPDRHNPDPFVILKLLPATDDNTAKVKSMIFAAK